MMNETLDMPRGPFVNFARWNLLSVLKTSDEFRELKRLVRWSHEPEKLELFIDLVEDDQGYPLYRAVSEAKMRLSAAEEAEFVFAPLGVKTKMTIRRADFEDWIAGDLQRIEGAMDSAMEAGLAAGDNCESVFRRAAKPGNGVRRRNRKLFKHQRNVDWITIDAARQINLCFDAVAISGAVGHSPLVAVDDARQEYMVLGGSGQLRAD